MVVGAVLTMGDAVGSEVGEDMLGIDLMLVATGMDDIGICHISGHDLDGLL